MLTLDWVQVNDAQELNETFPFPHHGSGFHSNSEKE